MALTLITGPANAAKAGAVLDRLAAANAAGRAPILVVPTAADLALFRRELGLRTDTVMGPRVMLFDGFVAFAAQVAGVAVRPLTRTQRERAVRVAAARAGLGPLAASAATAGFPAAAASFLGLLSATGQTPPRLARALTDWGEAAGREEHGRDLAALVLAYAGVLDGLGRPDEERFVRAVMDTLRLEPARWPGTPVFLYGFDDLTPVERDVVESLAVGPADVDVTLSLPAEPGRVAFGARLSLVADLAPLAAPHVELPADDAHYAPTARAELHAVERGLFEPGAARAPADADPSAVLLLEGGGERAELELVAARIAALMAGGVPPGEIAVATRALDRAAPLVLDVLADFGIPATARRTALVAETATGRGLAALLRCALDPEAVSGDLVAYLRTPGVVAQPERVDRLEATLRRGGVSSLAEARALWEAREWPLDAIDAIGIAAAEGGAPLLAAVERRAAALLAAPWRRQAAVLDADGRDEARAATAIRGWTAELLEVGALDPALLPAPDELADRFGELTVRLGTDPSPAAVAVLDPLTIRARRVRALFLVRMQEGEFPLLSRPDPFLDDDERRLLAATTGVRLPVLDDPLADERHLFYAAVSRPTELLAVSWHVADDDGGSPRGRSPFVDDLADVLPVDVCVHTRALGAVAWPDGAVPPESAPGRRAAIAAEPPRRAAPPAPLRHPAVLAALARQETFSPTALEVLLDCPVKWFVERWLRGRDLESTPESMAQGTLYHAVLQDVFATLAAPLTTARLAEAQRLLREAIRRHAREIPVSPNASRARASVRRLEVELDALLRHLARAEESGFRPRAFELAFGDGAALPAVPVGDGIALKGHIDRVDVDAERGAAVVVDYKGTSGVVAHADWIADRRIQAALYLHAARHVLNLQVDAALYQPIRGTKLTARGLVRAGVDPGLPVDPKDALVDEDFDALLTDVLVLVRDAVAQVRAGMLEPRPASCGYRDAGCQHPGICRLEGPAA